MRTRVAVLTLLALLGAAGPPASADDPPLVRSARSGRWSDPATWENGKVPAAGDRVQVRTGHAVTFDALVDAPIRSVHVAGLLRFDPDRDTRLTVGLVKVQAGDDACEAGFDCESRPGPPTGERPALEVGTASRPVAAGHTAVIRLAAVDGLDPDETPAVVCCGGRMEFHGAPLRRTWLKLGAPARPGDAAVTLAEPADGWRPGDRVIVTATRFKAVKDDAPAPSVRENPQTEERTVRAVEDGGTRLTLDAPLAFDHAGEGDYRGEVANLSRNVVVESADPAAARGHTMYHRHSAGSISYAEFRHLGKPGKLGKYTLHFHLVGDTMRGASVVGASLWDSGNRWITVHGTNRLVVRDCVGYRSLGHGFFLEDATEVENLFDRNLAVQACATAPLPGQVLAFDRNEGAGFWWANSQNAFTRNVAVECDGYGFRYDAPAVAGFDPVRQVKGPDGVRRPVDVRTLPFLRFAGNEAHAQRGYGLNLGGAAGSGASGATAEVGPDARHPFALDDLKVWASHWAVTPAVPSVLIRGLTVGYSDFGLWRPRYVRHAYRDVNYYRTRWPSFSEEGTRPDAAAFPTPLDPTDDRPPVSVITAVESTGPGRLTVRGVSADDTGVRAVRVNGVAARADEPGFGTWTAELTGLAAGPVTLTAVAEDLAGRPESDPHRAAAAVRD